MEKHRLETYKHGDGSVHRRFICTCGNVVYKKDLKTGEYTLQDKNYKSKLLPGKENGEYVYQCDCGLDHIVMNIKEEVEVGDNFETEKENV